MSWGNPTTPLDHFVKALLTPASLAYELGSYSRSQAYVAGVLPRTKLPVPVVSIGNITCGGTGKTPLTIDLAQRLSAAGKRVAVLSRGYKRQSSDPIVIVSNGKSMLADCRKAGDEPYLIARCAPEAIVIVGSDRSATARLAVEKYECNLILLDDGFQHQRLERDADLVLIDYFDQPQNDTVLPSGRLRESLAALNRASSVVITKVPDKPDLQKLENLTSTIRKYNNHAEITSCRFTAKEDARVRNSRVVAFCGIARPDAFTRMLEAMGASVERSRYYPDHYWYAEKDLQQLQRDVVNCKAEFIVTTQKDYFRIRVPDHLKSKLIAIELVTEWIGPVPAFLAAMLPVPA